MATEAVARTYGKVIRGTLRDHPWACPMPLPPHFQSGSTDVSSHLIFAALDRTWAHFVRQCMAKVDLPPILQKAEAAKDTHASYNAGSVNVHLAKEDGSWQLSDVNLGESSAKANVNQSRCISLEDDNINPLVKTMLFELEERGDTGWRIMLRRNQVWVWINAGYYQMPGSSLRLRINLPYAFGPTRPDFDPASPTLFPLLNDFHLTNWFGFHQGLVESFALHDLPLTNLGEGKRLYYDPNLIRAIASEKLPEIFALAGLPYTLRWADYEQRAVEWLEKSVFPPLGIEPLPANL